MRKSPLALVFASWPGYQVQASTSAPSIGLPRVSTTTPASSSGATSRGPSTCPGASPATGSLRVTAPSFVGTAAISCSAPPRSRINNRAGLPTATVLYREGGSRNSPRVSVTVSVPGNGRHVPFSQMPTTVAPAIGAPVASSTRPRTVTAAASSIGGTSYLGTPSGMVTVRLESLPGSLLKPFGGPMT